MRDEWIILTGWLLDLLTIPVNGLSVLPLLLILGFAAGRRGNATLCLNGNLEFWRLGVYWSLLIPLYYLLSFLALVIPMNTPEASIWDALFSLAGLPWLSSFVSALCGCLLFWSGLLCSRTVLKGLPIQKEKYSFNKFKPLVWFLLGAAAFFFAAFWLINWPFAGLPVGLAMDKAMMAIGRHAARAYFNALSSAGALCLLVCLYWRFDNSTQRLLAFRWFSFWAAIGYLPYAIVSLGYLLGVYARGSLAAMAAILNQALGLVFLIGAIICWLYILVGKRADSLPVYAGIVLLCCYKSIPAFLKISGVARISLN